MQRTPRQAARRLRRPSRNPPAASRAPGALRARVLAIVRGEAPATAVTRPARRARRAVRAGAAVGGGIAVLALLAIVGRESRPQPAARASASGAHAALRRVGTHAELDIAGLAQPPPGEVYEVWIVRPSGDAVATDALFTPTRDGAATVEVPGTVRAAGAVMVTREPRGGSGRPTSPAVLTLAQAPAR